MSFSISILIFDYFNMPAGHNVPEAHHFGMKKSKRAKARNGLEAPSTNKTKTEEMGKKMRRVCVYETVFAVCKHSQRRRESERDSWIVNGISGIGIEHCD